MRNLIVTLVMLVSGIISAQSFNFSCTDSGWTSTDNVEYTNSDFPTYSVNVESEVNFVSPNGIYIFTIFKDGVMFGLPHQGANGASLEEGFVQVEVTLKREIFGIDINSFYSPRYGNVDLSPIGLVERTVGEPIYDGHTQVLSIPGIEGGKWYFIISNRETTFVRGLVEAISSETVVLRDVIDGDRSFIGNQTIVVDPGLIFEVPNPNN